MKINKVFNSETSAAYSDKPEYNIEYLKAQENYFNEIINARLFDFGQGVVTLNEVLRALGMKEEPKLGNLFGWVKSGKDDFSIRFHPIKTETNEFYLEFDVERIEEESCRDDDDVLKSPSFNHACEVAKLKSENEYLKQRIDELKETIVRLAMIRVETM